jgi:tetratricopeptide (TPR) repeat protein
MQESIADFSTAIALTPGNAAAFFHRGKAQRSLSLDAAIKDLNTAVSLDPNNHQSHVELGVIYQYDKRDNDKAIAEYSEAIGLIPNAAWIYMKRADVYDHIKERRKAIADYEKGLALDPSGSSFGNSWWCSYYQERIEEICKAIEAEKGVSSAGISGSSARQGVSPPGSKTIGQVPPSNSQVEAKPVQDSKKKKVKWIKWVMAIFGAIGASVAGPFTMIVTGIICFVMGLGLEALVNNSKIKSP